MDTTDCVICREPVKGERYGVIDSFTLCPTSGCRVSIHHACIVQSYRAYRSAFNCVICRNPLDQEAADIAAATASSVLSKNTERSRDKRNRSGAAKREAGRQARNG